MKKIDLFFTAILVPIDFLMLILAAFTAYFLRFQALAEIRPIIFDLPFTYYIQASTVISLVWIIIFAANGLYAISGPRKILQDLTKIAAACSAGMMILIIFIFFQRELFSSRFILLAAWLLSIIFVWAARTLIKAIRWSLLKKGIGRHNVIVLGDSKNAGALVEAIKTRITLGLDIKGNLKFNEKNLISQLAQALKQYQIDEIILAEPAAPRQTIAELIRWTQLNHIGFRYAPDLYDSHVARVEVAAIAGIPLVEIKKTRLDGWGKIYKKIFDLAGAVILIALTSPIMLLTALAIKLNSKGPVFWSRLDNGQPVIRVGRYGQPFKYFKFRSMVTGAHAMRYNELAKQNTRQDGPFVKIKNDPRITTLGRFIRRFSIDELPELFLVLKGKMSLVGPRPHFPEEVAKFPDEQKATFALRPGITGLAQISGRSDLDFLDELALDKFYMENWSMVMDIAILLKTPVAVFRSRRAE